MRFRTNGESRTTPSSRTSKAVQSVMALVRETIASLTDTQEKSP